MTRGKILDFVVNAMRLSNKGAPGVETTEKEKHEEL